MNAAIFRFILEKNYITTVRLMSGTIKKDGAQLQNSIAESGDTANKTYIGWNLGIIQKAADNQ